ncbi:MAG: zinc dependent phospholipase C family protein, partial [Acidobacteriaceae bacterium]|nr:zinc dependent phospholipase C family protein [Acidobacteriaceae bacterium]
MPAHVRSLCVALAGLFIGIPVFGCSVLSHEAIVDALWDVKLKPVLQSVYPQSTPEELKRAHGFAYGGAIIQDLGYYPHGNKMFSDLAHYVRTGDFVLALIAESQSLDELAFALGALSHYTSDVYVHREATNPGEPMLYPKLERKFGPIVTYAEDPAAHLKTEFGFDVLEVAKGRFAPEAYHDFIGFYVAQDVLGRAFHDVYGIPLSDLFPNFNRTIGSFRRDVSKWIP